ncbi:MAG: hypothetical protein NW203_14940 [Hyphomonadaceae bacterium]|nr:hypothetical protein [Hyphomonadaceae bacterium]
MTRMREEQALKPVGLALAAVMAGLAGQAHALEPAAPEAQTRVFADDETNHPGADQDPTMILGPSAPVEPFAERPAPAQGDLFGLG